MLGLAEWRRLSVGTTTWLLLTIILISLLFINVRSSHGYDGPSILAEAFGLLNRSPAASAADIYTYDDEAKIAPWQTAHLSNISRKVTTIR